MPSADSQRDFKVRAGVHRWSLANITSRRILCEAAIVQLVVARNCLARSLMSMRYGLLPFCHNAL